MARLDALSDNHNQKNITYFCFAILFMFFFCQLPHGIWLAFSGFTLSGNVENKKIASGHYGSNQANSTYQPSFLNELYTNCHSKKTNKNNKGATLLPLTHSFNQLYLYHESSKISQQKRGSTRPPTTIYEEEDKRMDQSNHETYPSQYPIFLQPSPNLILHGSVSEISESSLFISLMLNTTGDHEHSCYKFRITTSNEASCTVKAKWNKTYNPKVIHYYHCLHDSLHLQFDTEYPARCFGIWMDKQQQQQMNGSCSEPLPIDKIAIYSRHKNIAQIVYATLNDESAVITVVLLLLTSSFNFLVFYKYYGPFRREFKKMIKGGQ